MRVRNRVPKRNLGIVAVSLVLASAFVSAADAAQVDVNGGVLRYVASTSIPPVTANDVTITHAGATYTIDDPAEPAVDLAPGALAAGCEPFDSNTVTCPDAAVTSLDVATGGLADRIDLTGVPVPARVAGGDADDFIVGGNGDDTFSWSPGDDNDTIDGGPGVDTLVFNGSVV